MMIISEEERENFENFLQDYYNSLPSDQLSKVRAKAFDAVAASGLPSSKEEVFQYVPLRKLYGNAWSTASGALHVDEAQVKRLLLDECGSHVVFVNGVFRKDLSNVSSLPTKVVVNTLNEAAIAFSAVLDNQMNRMMKDEADPFVLINAALMHAGAFIYLPPNVIVDKPLHILNIIAGQDAHFVNPRIQLFAAHHSQINIISTQADLRSQREHPYFNNTVFDIALDDEARVKYTQMSDNLQPHDWHFEALRAHLKRGSDLNTVAITKGSQTVRNDYRVVLAGEGAAAHLNGLAMLSDKNEAHTHILMDHQAPHCQSNQLFKTVLRGFSEASFEGKIFVRQAAQKTDAFQLNNNLLLSERAQARSKPNLEIYADDVKASHGATFGQLDESQLFYLRTRGLSESAAKNLLVHGYCEEIIAMIDLPDVQQRVAQQSLNFVA